MSAASSLSIQLHIFHSSVLYLGAYQSQLVTQSEAVRKCSEHGGVASFEYLNPPPGTEHLEPEPKKYVPARLQRLLTELNIRDGESIWVSGRPVFSDFIDQISCQTSLNPAFYKKFTLPENNLYTSWDKCKHMSETFRLNLTDCYCINVLESAFFKNDQDKTGIQLYSIINYSVFNRMAPFQCVLMTYTNGNSIKHSTNKCSVTNPGICVIRLTDKQTLTCANVTDKDDMCVFNESRTWAENF
ncbi:hypothetical protein DPMN_079923 [Dreissena polymorpha]|uniref:Uncharacterized protein n=1 Tax=Dreissena polymorpha TaxID=45954 RepID=A0A9D3YQG0_DREPO|nr:hypothetical protein DPMN_079923 [Dreissena polymorpha]